MRRDGSPARDREATADALDGTARKGGAASGRRPGRPGGAHALIFNSSIAFFMEVPRRASARARLPISSFRPSPGTLRSSLPWL